MPSWTYQPQEVYADLVTVPARINNVTLAEGVVGLDAESMVRKFRLQYGVVTQAEAAGMRDFFIARGGSYESFDWINPNDNRTYHVRFSSSMKLELFTPIFFSNGQLDFDVVP